MNTFDAIVIGGGFAGLSAATALAEHGYRVAVFEANRHLGGRAASYVDAPTGDRIDCGQHVLFGCYRETQRFLTRLGSEELVRYQAQFGAEIVLDDGRRSTFVCPPLPAPVHLVAGVLEWNALSWRDRVAALRLRAPLAIARKTLRPLDPDQLKDGLHPQASRLAASPGETVGQWLVRNGQTPRLIQLLWEPLAMAATNQPIEVAAAGPFVDVLARLFGSSPMDASIGLPQQPLSALYEPARAFVERRGGVVRTSIRAALVPGNPMPIVAAGPARYRAPVVIVAVAWFNIPTVCAGLTELGSTCDAASRTGAWPIVSVHLWLDRPIMQGPFVGLSGRTFQWVFESPWSGTSPRVTAIVSAAAPLAPLDNRALMDLARQEIASALPAMRHATVRKIRVVRERRATFSLAPGQPRRPATRTGIPGLFLAGDWVDTGLPATIESAAASGHAAAAAAREHL